MNDFLDLQGYTSDGEYLNPRIERFPKADITPIPTDPIKALPYAINAATYLMAEGMDVDMTSEEAEEATKVFLKKKTMTQSHVQSAAIAIKLGALLSEYDHRIVRDAEQLRTYTTNRLIELSNHDDPRVQLRALEDIGKITEVGLFTERSIVTVQHQTTAELQAELKKTIDILLDPEDYEVINDGQS